MNRRSFFAALAGSLASVPVLRGLAPKPKEFGITYKGVPLEELSL